MCHRRERGREGGGREGTRGERMVERNGGRWREVTIDEGGTKGGREEGKGRIEVDEWNRVRT